MTAAGSYRPEPLTAEQKAANEQAARDAMDIVAASFLAETADRRLNRRLRDQQDRAARLARWMARQPEGGRR